MNLASDAADDIASVTFVKANLRRTMNQLAEIKERLARYGSKHTKS
jgi:hypothetical protein